MFIYDVLVYTLRKNLFSWLFTNPLSAVYIPMVLFVRLKSSYRPHAKIIQGRIRKVTLFLYIFTEMYCHGHLRDDKYLCIYILEPIISKFINEINERELNIQQLQNLVFIS